MGKAADWLREERRKTLGDWVAVCLNCGFAQRYFEEWEDELPAACPQCERRDALQVSDVRCAVLFRVRRRLRELRSGAQADGAVRRPDPP